MAYKPIISFFLIALVSGCDTEQSNQSEKIAVTESQNLHESCRSLEGEMISCTFESFKCEGSLVTYSDELNDTQIGLVDLTDLSVSLGNQCLLISINLRNFPESLTVNHLALGMNSINYSWGVFFDIDNNQKPSKGDLAISLDQYKFEESEKQVKSTKIGLGHLVEYETAGTNQFFGNTKVFFNGLVENNQIKLFLPLSTYHKLNKITHSNLMLFTSQFNDGVNKYSDQYSSKPYSN
jgi:hypothetical protein